MAESLWLPGGIFSFGSGYEKIPLPLHSFRRLCFSILWYIILVCYSCLGIWSPWVFLMVSDSMATNSLACGHVTVHLNIIGREFAEFLPSFLAISRFIFFLYCLSISYLPFSLLLFIIYGLSFLCALIQGVDGSCILWVVGWHRWIECVGSREYYNHLFPWIEPTKNRSGEDVPAYCETVLRSKMLVGLYLRTFHCSALLNPAFLIVHHSLYMYKKRGVTYTLFSWSTPICLHLWTKVIPHTPRDILRDTPMVFNLELSPTVSCRSYN